MDKSLKPSLLVIALIGAIATLPGQPGADQAKGLAQGAVTPGRLPPALAKTGEGSKTPAQPSAPIALSNDGQWLVRGTETGQLEWLDGQGKVLRIVKAAHSAAISGVALTPDGQIIISAAVDGTLRRWNRAGQPLSKAVSGQGGAILALAISPDGRTAVTGNQRGTIERWSVANGNPFTPVIAAGGSPIQAIHYAADGKNFFTGSGKGSLARWSAEGGLLKQVDGAHQGGITTLTTSPYGKVITSGGGDGMIRSWDQTTLLPEGKPISAHQTAVTAIAYSANGTTVATAAADKSLRLWGGDGAALPSVPIALSSAASFLGFTPAGKLVIGTADHQLTFQPGRPDLESKPDVDPAASPVDPVADLWSQIQTLPPQTWWILLAVPGALCLFGLLASVRRPSGQPQGESNPVQDQPLTSETPGQPLAAAGMGINFSQLGQSPSSDQTLSLPPEAELVSTVSTDTPDAATPDQLEQARSQMVEGKRLMREQRYDLALIRFNTAIEATELERLKATAHDLPRAGVNVIAAQAQAQRGNALLAMEQMAEAMESYNIALGFDTTNLDAWLGKGRLLSKLERHEEALFCFDTVLETDKTPVLAWSGKAEALMQLGRQAEAQSCIDRAVALGGEAYRPPTLTPAALTLGQVLEVPVDAINPATSPASDRSPSPGVLYDPDIPLELQQMVQVLPSAESGWLAAIPPASPSQSEPSPEPPIPLAQLPTQPDQSELSLDLPADLPADLAVALAQLPTQPDQPDQSELSLDLPADLAAALAQLPTQPDQPDQSELSLDLPADLAAALAQLPDQPDQSADVSPDLPPLPRDPGPTPTPFPQGVEEELLHQVALSVTLPPAITDEITPVAATLAALPLVLPGDTSASPTGVGASPAPDQPLSSPPSRLSWLQLSIDQKHPDRFYARWHLEDSDRDRARQQGGQTLAVRLYDVTGQGTDTPLTDPVQEQRCQDDLAEDWYLPIPQWDRIYLAAVGYLGDDNAWYAIAQSPELGAISG
ncbi:MAG: DUF4912 domain-containing protein [Cyanobacteria bacterium REEB459]|nr:DUF4912 domain-containing protein [Cyanobacteria bacterium REEB459]